MEFWDRVQARIEDQGKSQKLVAESLGIRPDMLSRWIHREILPDAAQAVGIAAALNTTVEFLVTGKSSSRTGLSEKVSGIAGLLMLLDPRQLQTVSAMVQGLTALPPIPVHGADLSFSAGLESEAGVPDAKRIAAGKHPEGQQLRKGNREKNA